MVVCCACVHVQLLGCASDCVAPLPVNQIDEPSVLRSELVAYFLDCGRAFFELENISVCCDLHGEAFDRAALSVMAAAMPE